MVLKEKSNFDNIEKAAKYFYADYVDGDSAYIRATLSKLGHSETFIDAVFDAMSARYDEEELYWDDLDESVNVVYDKDGKTNRFYLDFNNPSDLYRELEKHCGYDFATQFRDEFEHWKEINIDEVKECWSGDMTDVRDILGEALDSLEKVSLYIMKNGTVPEIDDLRDIINESEDKIGEAKAIADDFFDYGFGSEED
jgi:hypothetical protein